VLRFRPFPRVPLNELQDSICDRLVGTPAGKNWVDGPLSLATQVLAPASQMGTRGNRFKQRMLARALGWPLPFCEAVHGSYSGLASEDDRRALAIAVFGKVAPKQSFTTNGKRSRDAAAWAVPRAHRRICSPRCPFTAALDALVAVHQAGKSLYSKSPFTRKNRCLRDAGSQEDRIVPGCPPEQPAVVAARYLYQALLETKARLSVGDALRELVFRAVQRWHPLPALEDDLTGDCQLVLIQSVAAFNRGVT
jgi:hypothetical protein